MGGRWHGYQFRRLCTVFVLCMQFCAALYNIQSCPIPIVNGMTLERITMQFDASASHIANVDKSTK